MKSSNSHRSAPTVFWSEPDQHLIAKIPDLPGRMADGASYREAVAQAEIVVPEWIETARDLGREIPEPSRRSAALI